MSTFSSFICHDSLHFSIVFRGQTYTFDHVFGLELSQTDLYQNTAAPMLKNFLDGYNCTIMAYGQTGSGKTYTMGTSDINCQDIESQGLIPRFVNDLFENLNQPQDNFPSDSDQQSETSYKIKVSFLEIYGEDVFDLLSSSASTRSAADRASLPVREDESGRVFVQGQSEIEVKSALATLDALSLGSHNRITASTAMNAGSSRSHAVFTLHLEQSIRTGTNQDDVNTVTSKLTFVDLAGSERIKRTGAEGQRLKEGIQINSGLFNLGQVINSLADEQKLKHGNPSKNNFVPYRNSKLTHLLKDALGGNSQTLFLACISPAESNESESHSTLNYARQARNIKNKPVRNLDKQQLELKRLRLTAKAWMMKAISLMFGSSASPKEGDKDFSSSVPNSFHSPTRTAAKKLLSPSSATFTACRQPPSLMTSFNSTLSDEEALLRRPEVIEFINTFNASIQEKLDLASPSPRKIRLSLGFSGYHAGGVSGSLLRSPTLKASSHPLTGVKKNLYQQQPSVGEDVPSMNAFNDIPTFPSASFKPSGRESILMTADINNALEAANNLDETEQLVERMIDMVNKEKKLLAGVHHPHHHVHSSPGEDELLNEGNAESGDEDVGATNAGYSLSNLPSASNSVDEEEILEVDRLIQEKEDILNKLMDNIKSYNTIKLEFEKLVDAINNLEKEKTELEVELEKAKKTNTSSLQLEKMKERFLTIKDELKKMQQDKRSKESMYQLMQKESKQCDTMQREIQKLKESKVTLLKQQKSANLALQKLKKENQMKIQSMKKSEIKKQQLMNSLKSELTKKERIIGHKDRELNRVTMKLKACEDHITQLLRLQNRQRNKIVNPNNISNNNLLAAASKESAKNNTNKQAFFQLEKYKSQLENADYDYYQTSKNLIEQVIISQIEKKIIAVQYHKKATELKELNSDLLAQTEELQSLQRLKQEIITEHQLPSTSDLTGEENAMFVAGMPNLVSEEIHYELENILQRIQYTENQIERISKEIDLYNSDLDDLSLRLEQVNNTLSSGASNNSNSQQNLTEGGVGVSNNWQNIGNEIISSFSLGQSQLLINELLNDKLTYLEAMKLLEINGQKTKTSFELLQEKHADLISYNKQMNQIFLQRMKNLEKQRISEIWTILKNSTTTNENAKEQAGGFDEVAKEITNSITVLRAKELEKECESLLMKEEELKEENSSHKSLIAELEYQLRILQNQIANYQQMSPATNTIADGNEKIETDFLQEISHYWNEMGVEPALQQEMIQSILQSQSIMQQKLLMESKQEFSFQREEIQKFLSFIDSILAFTGLTFPQFIAQYTKSSQGMNNSKVEKYHPLLQDSSEDFLKIKPQKDCVEVLLAYLFNYCVEFYGKYYPQFSAMKEQAQSLVTEMMLNLQEPNLNHSITLSASFIQLMKWKSPIIPSQWNLLVQTVTELANSLVTRPDDRTTEEKQKMVVVEVMKIVQSLTHNFSLTVNKAWKEVDSELKHLNLRRIQITNQIIALRDQILLLTSDQSLSISAEEFTTLARSIIQNPTALMSMSGDEEIMGRNSFGEGEIDQQALEKVYHMALQILSKKTLSNPPGSEQIVVFLEKLKFLLESIQCNRTNLANLMISLVSQWLDYFSISGSTDQTSANFSSAAILQRIQIIHLKESEEENERVVNLSEFLKMLKDDQALNDDKKMRLANLYKKEIIFQLFQVIQEIVEKKWKDLYQYQFDSVLSYLKAFNNVSTNANASAASSAQNLVVLNDITSSLTVSVQTVCKQLVQYYQAQAKATDGDDEGESTYNNQMLQVFSDFFEECSNMVVFLEEGWIQSALLSLLTYWKQSIHHSSYYAELSTYSEFHVRYSLQDIFYQTSFLYSESQRLQNIYETFLEMKKQDTALIKHIQELEEFENQSNKDRAKVLLSGNSKLLMEEEKYRKNAKKKYEVISEKLVNIFQKLINLTTSTTSPINDGSSSDANFVANSGIMIECKIDLNCFSQYTQSILKNGIQKEKLELIRLHTSAAAMFNSIATAATVPATTSATATANTGNSNHHAVLTKRTSTDKDKEKEKDNASVSSNTSTGVAKKSNLYQKSKEKVGTKSAASSKTALSTKEAAVHKSAAPSTVVAAVEHPTVTSTSTNASTHGNRRMSSSRLSSSHHNAHRLSINSRLSISTIEPGLIAHGTGKDGNSSNYAFQPPTPPSLANVEEEEGENDPGNLNILTGIPSCVSPLKSTSSTGGKAEETLEAADSSDVMDLSGIDMNFIEASL